MRLLGVLRERCYKCRVVGHFAKRFHASLLNSAPERTSDGGRAPAEKTHAMRCAQLHVQRPITARRQRGLGDREQHSPIDSGQPPENASGTATGAARSSALGQLKELDVVARGVDHECQHDLAERAWLLGYLAARGFHGGDRGGDVRNTQDQVWHRILNIV